MKSYGAYGHLSDRSNGKKVIEYRQKGRQSADKDKHATPVLNMNSREKSGSTRHVATRKLNELSLTKHLDLLDDETQ